MALRYWSGTIHTPSTLLMRTHPNVPFFRSIDTMEVYAAEGECMDAVHISDSLIGYCSNWVLSVVLANRLFHFTGVF